MKFYELAIGARFAFRGERFEKTAHGMASGRGIGHVFRGVVDVVAEEGAPLLPPEEAAKWKPDERDWADYLGPAPGERGG